MEFSILYLIAFPEIQAKVCQEVDRVIGEQRPSLEHLEKMPFTRAFMEEAFRFMPTGLLPPARKCKQDVKLKSGIVIPKDTQVAHESASIVAST